MIVSTARRSGSPPWPPPSSFILWFGLEFILSPETTAPGFGLQGWPSGDGGGFLSIKGIRDVVLALVLGVLLVTGHRRALGWVLLVEALAAYGDMTTVLAYHGSEATALNVHGDPSDVAPAEGLMAQRGRAVGGVRLAAVHEHAVPDGRIPRTQPEVARGPRSAATWVSVRCHGWAGSSACARTPSLCDPGYP
ncbi:DUF4267 domain-containing protein [Micromonospora sp. 067-2]|uniref:DUF4267 domain-containing protein n=1 Tax=Micromonospora sp. 067-2 TaxID=2789270 RepID=UPI0039793864